MCLAFIVVFFRADPFGRICPFYFYDICNWYKLFSGCFYGKISVNNCLKKPSVTFSKSTKRRAMNKKISIKTDNPALYGLLNSDLPDGVQIISDSPYEGRGIELSLTTDVQISVDLEAVTKNDFAAWLINRVRVLKGNHKINRQQIPFDNPEAIELITREIE